MHIIDAGKLVQELQKHCPGKVNVIKSDVVGVNKDDNGDIISLDPKNGTTHESIFILTAQVLLHFEKAKRVELLGEGRLFTNTAVAGCRI